jgi:hypothetical protein
VAAVIAAVLVGIFLGLCLRPLLDAYLRFKTAELYADERTDDKHDHTNRPT